MAREEFNKQLGKLVALASIIFAVVWNLYISLSPATAFAFLDALDQKWIAFTVGNLFILASGLLVYVHCFEPTIKRHSLFRTRASFSLAIFSSAMPWALQRLSLETERTDVMVQISFESAGIASVATLAIALTGSWCYSLMYERATKYEAETGKRI